MWSRGLGPIYVLSSHQTTGRGSEDTISHMQTLSLKVQVLRACILGLPSQLCRAACGQYPKSFQTAGLRTGYLLELVPWEQ